MKAITIIQLITINIFLLFNPNIGMTQSTSIQAMEWRFVGPVQGGRGTSVEMHPTNEQVFYAGYAAGGLWKTEDAGQYWENISDGQINVGAIGAIAVSPSNPDIIYVGTGEPQLRHDVSYGDGVYKSVDGGKTFNNVGLPKSYHISRVRIHPTNPDIVYVGALGSAFGYNEERGVYKTIDGGKTWEKVLYKSEKAGVIDLVMDPNNPEILYAATFQFIRKDWTVESGGEDSRLYKTIDGGKTWSDVSSNNGFPQEVLGRMGLAMSKANSNIIYSLTDTETMDGIYRSDDGGENWTLVSDDANLTVRPFYFNHLYANPHNADDLWVLTNKLWQSLDGGKSWKQRSGTKDDFHDMMIDPNNPNRMINTHDGGTMVTMTAGKTWSGTYTQRTAQAYRVHTDNQWPYNLYTNVQDLVGYKVPSASFWGGIARGETEMFGSSEAGYAVPHRTEENIVYQFNAVSMGGFGGFTVTNFDAPAYQERHVYSDWSFGTPAAELKYRFGWMSAVATSVHNPDVVYFGGNYLWKSTDKGYTWTKISDDLTTNNKKKQALPGGQLAVETSGAEIYGLIVRMAVSKANEGTIWTGSDDGLIYLTKDEGANWENITPKELPKDIKVLEIIESAHDPAVAYAAFTRIKSADDRNPYLYKTEDFGKSWTNISITFPEGEITRTICEDQMKPGLLWVGTETGIFYSTNDGGSWSKMNNGFPTVPVYHITQKNEDLVVATHGRGLWILDDVTPMRTMVDASKNQLFKPRDTYRYGYNFWQIYGGGVGEGQKNYFVQNHRPGHTFYELGIVNGEMKRKFIDAGDARPNGVMIYYNLANEGDDVSLSIQEMDGTEIMKFGTEQISTNKGLNRFVWNTSYPNAKAIPGKPNPNVRPLAKPGMYKAVVTVNGDSQEQEFELFMNPNETFSDEEAVARFALWIEIRDKYSEVSDAIIHSREVVAEVKAAAKASGSKKAIKKATEIELASKDLESSMTAVGTTLVQIANERSKYLAKIQAVTEMLHTSEGAPTQGAIDAYADYEKAIDEELSKWKVIEEVEVKTLKEIINK